MKCLFLIFTAMALAPTRALAYYVELNSYYVGETLTTASNSTSSRMFGDFSAGFEVDRNQRFLVGWNYGLHQTTDTTTTTTAYASTQMGPRFLWFMTRTKSWSLGAGYNVLTTATYSAGGGVNEKWTGSSIMADLGYNYTFNETLYIGIRANYSAATYISKLNSSNTYTDVSYSMVYIYPSLSFVFLF